MPPISDARAAVLDAVARGILIQSAMMWMRPQSALLAAYSVEPPYGRIVEISHGFAAIDTIERDFIVGLVEACVYRHPSGAYRPFQLRWDPTINEFRWTLPPDAAVDTYL